MKKLLFLIASALMFCTGSMKAQITLDFTVKKAFYGYLFYPVKISDSETKYVSLDTASNTFSLYNLDLTPFLTNIATPDVINPFGSLYYDIMYVTRTLFDCDSATIEYLYAEQNNPSLPLWVMRTDGTVLFRADSSRGPYCFGCPGGATVLSPIFNTEEGAKLVVMKDTINTGQGLDISIYSLCGKIPVGFEEYDFSSQQASHVELYPNPSAMQLNFKITLPDNVKDYELIILNGNAQELKRERLRTSESMYSMDVRNYSSGTYYYSLASKNKIVQTGKFILTK